MMRNTVFPVLSLLVFSLILGFALAYSVVR